MILYVNSDGSYLSISKIRIREGGISSFQKELLRLIKPSEMDLFVLFPLS